MAGDGVGDGESFDPGGAGGVDPMGRIFENEGVGWGDFEATEAFLENVRMGLRPEGAAAGYDGVKGACKADLGQEAVEPFGFGTGANSEFQADGTGVGNDLIRAAIGLKGADLFVLSPFPEDVKVLCRDGESGPFTEGVARVESGVGATDAASVFSRIESLSVFGKDRRPSLERDPFGVDQKSVEVEDNGA